MRYRLCLKRTGGIMIGRSIGAAGLKLQASPLCLIYLLALKSLERLLAVGRCPIAAANNGAPWG